MVLLKRLVLAVGAILALMLTLYAPLQVRATETTEKSCADNLTETVKPVEYVNLPFVYRQLANRGALISQKNAQTSDLNSWFDRAFLGKGLCGPTCAANIMMAVESAENGYNYGMTHNAHYNVRSIIDHINIYGSGRATSDVNIIDLVKALNRNLHGQGIYGGRLRLAYESVYKTDWSVYDGSLRLIAVHRTGAPKGHALNLLEIKKNGGDWRAIISDPMNPNHIVWDKVYRDRDKGLHFLQHYGYITAAVKVHLAKKSEKP